MNGLDIQPQAPPPWMQLAPVAPMQQQGGGMGDLAGALTGLATKKLIKPKVNATQAVDAPMPKPAVGADPSQALGLLGAIGGLA